MTVRQPYKPANHLEAPKSDKAVRQPEGRRDSVLASREKWLQPDRYREPADLVAHNNWSYSGDPLKTFAKTFPADKR
jgi:hypothetical protein